MSVWLHNPWVQLLCVVMGASGGLFADYRIRCWLQDRKLLREIDRSQRDIQDRCKQAMISMLNLIIEYNRTDPPHVFASTEYWDGLDKFQRTQTKTTIH